MSIASTFNSLGKGIVSVLDATNAAIDYVATPLLAANLGIRTAMVLGLGFGFSMAPTVIGGIVGGVTLAYAFNQACKYSADALLGADKEAEAAEAAEALAPARESTEADKPVRAVFSDAGKTARTPRPSFASRVIKSANDRVRNALGDGPMAMPVPV